MATPVGTNIINSLSRRFILPTVTDNVYASVLMFFRLNSRGKKMVQGGYQIEAPLDWSRFAAGGWYQGFDALDVSPSDVVKNAAWDWKFADVPVTIDGPSLIKSDSPEAVVNTLQFLFTAAESEMATVIGAALWANSQVTKQVDSIPAAVDTGSVASSYGGLTHSGNTFWNGNVTGITPPLALATMQTIFGTCTSGGRHPTIIVTTQAVYNLYWALSTGGQSFPVQPAGHDEQLAQNGFTNLLFNGVPVVVDPNVPSQQMYFLNEDYWYLFVQPNRDFYLRDFVIPVNQDAYTSLLLWAGNAVCTNISRQGKLTGISS